MRVIVDVHGEGTAFVARVRMVDATGVWNGDRELRSAARECEGLIDATALQLGSPGSGWTSRSASWRRSWRASWLHGRRRSGSSKVTLTLTFNSDGSVTGAPAEKPARGCPSRTHTQPS